MAKWDHEDLKDARYKRKEDGGQWEQKEEYPPEEFYKTLQKQVNYHGAIAGALAGQPGPKFKYSEDQSIAEISEYIKSTYNQHYVGANNIQVFDVWGALDSFETSCRDTAIKYIMRYGKKKGHNRDDLLKCVHYILMLMHYHNKFHQKVS